VVRRPCLDLAQAQHVGERTAGGGEIRVGGGTEVRGAERERLSAQRKRAEVFLEPCLLAPLSRRDGQHDALTHDQVALGLLHAGIRA
jgi:hypothetical protein